MSTPIHIAIDGPVGAGKSTLAKILSEKLGLTYIYTGAMYRAVALYVRKLGISWEDKEAVESVVSSIDIDLLQPKKGDNHVVRVLLSGKDVSNEVFANEVSEGASIVSQYSLVRTVLVDKQRALARGKSVIMDGRDIGTNVLPLANLKIYLDADMDERVRRKQKQLNITQAQAESDVLTRDRREMSRANDPLKPAKDAWILDTTEHTLDEVVEMVILRLREMNLA